MNIQTIGVGGFSYFIVEIEADVRFGLFKFDIIGLADKTIEESKLRILSAVRNSQILDHNKMNQKIVILLSPANIKKEGTYFDVPIAIAYLQAINSVQINHTRTGWISFGELGLKGNIRSVKNLYELLLKACELGFSKYIIPKKDFDQVKNIQNIPSMELFPAEHLTEVVNFLQDDSITPIYTKQQDQAAKTKRITKETFIINSIEDQDTAIRALTIALAGKHHLLLYGSPGTGKSMLAKSAEEILQEAVLLSGNSTIPSHTFRSPHHTISHTELVGNSKQIGEIHKAHGGVLFLDEISEFNRRALEALRQPLEEGYSFLHETFSNSGGNFSENSRKIRMPADFILIGASNKCRCGYFESTLKKCTCTALMVKQYQARLSGPILDRIDLNVYMNEYNAKIHTDTKGVRLMGKNIVEQVMRVQSLQQVRIRDIGPTSGENFVRDKKILRTLLAEQVYANLADNIKPWFQDLCTCLHISKREEVGILLTARTIADLEKSELVQQVHIIETVSFRRKS